MGRPKVNQTETLVGARERHTRQFAWLNPHQPAGFGLFRPYVYWRRAVPTFVGSVDQLPQLFGALFQILDGDTNIITSLAGLYHRRMRIQPSIFDPANCMDRILERRMSLGDDPAHSRGLRIGQDCAYVSAPDLQGSAAFR